MDEETYVEIVELAPNVPRSEIVYRELVPDLNIFKEIAHELYKKYVERGAPFEINISSKMRRGLKAKMGDHDRWMNINIMEDELAAIFDPAMRENMKLLQQSKKRLDSKLERLSADDKK